jgi:cytochrome P460
MVVKRKPLTFAGVLLLTVVGALGHGFFQNDEALRFTGKGEMIFPEHYREWVWLSSGLGMSYSSTAADADPAFDNVFVSPQAYRSFGATGAWPPGSVFMLEIRRSHGQGSINRAGRYQGDLQDVEAHVKKADGTWAFYAFGEQTKPARVIPRQASCYSCHEEHGAVDTTFVQFYPTLLKVAREKKTLNEKALLENK